MCYCKNEEFSQLLHGFIALVSKRVGGSSKCSQIMNIIHIKSSFEVEYVNTQKSHTTRRNIYSLADKEGRRRGAKGGQGGALINGTEQTSAFTTHAQSRYASAVLNGVLGLRHP